MESSTNASCNVLGLSYTEIPIRARRVARTPFVEKAVTFRGIERLLSALFLLLIVSLLINYLSLSLEKKERNDTSNESGISFQFPYNIVEEGTDKGEIKNV